MTLDFYITGFLFSYFVYFDHFLLGNKPDSDYKYISNHYQHISLT